MVNQYSLAGLFGLVAVVFIYYIMYCILKYIVKKGVKEALAESSEFLQLRQKK